MKPRQIPKIVRVSEGLLYVGIGKDMIFSKGFEKPT